MQIIQKNTYPKQYPLGINGISIPVDEVEKCQPLSQDASELAEYLSYLEVMAATTGSSIDGTALARFISPAMLMAKLILKRAIEHEKKIYGCIAIVVFAPVFISLQIPLANANELRPTAQNIHTLQILLKNSQTTATYALKLAKKYQSRLACYETLINGMGEPVECAGGSK